MTDASLGERELDVMAILWDSGSCTVAEVRERLDAPLAYSAGVQGHVLAQYVVDSTGSVDRRTFKVLKSDHAMFSNATREALASMQFTLATVGGERVSQLMQTSFAFTPSR